MKTRTKNRSHTGKRAHATEAEALNAMRALINRNLAESRQLHVYECTFGPTKHWHVGHRGVPRWGSR